MSAEFDMAGVIKEIEERDRRSSSVMIFNLPESKSGRGAARKSYDIGSVKTICGEILEVDEVSISNASRIGEKRGPQHHAPTEGNPIQHSDEKRNSQTDSETEGINGRHRKQDIYFRSHPDTETRSETTSVRKGKKTTRGGVNRFHLDSKRGTTEESKENEESKSSTLSINRTDIPVTILSVNP